MAVSQNELDAVKGVREYGKYSLLASVVGIVTFFLFYFYLLTYTIGLYTVGMSHPSPLGTPAVNPFDFVIWIFLIFALILLAIIIIALFFIHKAFAAMEKDDAKKFGTPLTMVRISITMLVVGIVLAVLGALSSSAAFLVIGIVLFVMGGIALDWGITLGLWRFGSEYENAVLKIGAITAAFSTLPGLIFVYLGAGEIGKELGVSK